MNCPIQLDEIHCSSCHWFEMEGACTYPSQDNVPDRVALKCQKCGHEFWVRGERITTSAGECPKCKSFRTVYDEKRDKAVAK